MTRSRHGALLAALLGLTCGQVGCGAGESTPGSSGPEITISVAPLSLLDVTNACYRLVVTHGADVVWRADGVCASSYGDQRGSISYIGPCDASGDGMNEVSLVLETLHVDGAATPLAPDLYVNPCGDPALPSYDGFAACRRTVECEENADARVDFDLTVMRNASQGFFDIAVEFEDIFCSAKVDCRYEGETEPIALLFDEDGERDTTVVMAFSCTTGKDTPTILYMDDITVSCGAETFPIPPIDPSLGPGLLGISDELFFDVAVYRGLTTAATANAVYWNVALGIRDDLGPALGEYGDLTNCVLRGAVTASETAFTLGVSPAEHTYPWLEIVVPLNGPDALSCTQHPIGAGTDTTGVIPRYTGDEGRAFDTWFDGSTAQRARPLPAACTTSADCAAGLVCEGGFCLTAPGGDCGGAPCVSGHTCVGGVCMAEAHQGCGAGVSCAPGLTCDEGECLPGLGVPCPSAQCAEGLQCVEGVCVAEIGQACTSDDHCLSGWCRESLCAPVSCQDQILYAEVPPCELSAGVCAGLDKPTERCDGAGTWQTCSADDYLAHSASYDPAPEVDCDGLDNNCDGRVDEGCVGELTLALMSGGAVGQAQHLAVGQAIIGATSTTSLGFAPIIAAHF